MCKQKKEKFLMLLLAFFLSNIIGCSSVVSEKTKYYSLEGISLVNNSSICGKNCIKLLIQVDVPDYLDSNGIVYYSDSMDKITVATKNLWLEELSIQLKNILENKINNSINDYYAFDSRMNIKHDVLLQIFIQKFNGEKDGNVVVSGTYVFNNQKDTIKQGAFTVTEKQSDNGFDSLVDRLNELWLKECDKLIKELFYNNK